MNIFSVSPDYVRFHGRVLADLDKKVWFNWSGSGFSFDFSGTCVKAYLFTDLLGGNIWQANDLAYIGVFIDDNPYQIARFPLNKSQGWYTLAEGLSNKKHTIYVVKQTEVGNGRSAVSAIQTDAAVIKPSSEKPLKIEFIGDSITCGYGNICSTQSSEFITAEENFSLTYAAMTCRQLNAELYCIAASGNGFYHDYGCNTHNLIPELYEFSDKMLSDHLDITPEQWDFKNNKLDAVIIKLGQNDGQYCMGTDLPIEKRTPELLRERCNTFAEVAAGFLKTIKIKHQATPVFVIYEEDMFLADKLIIAINRAGNGIIPVKIASKTEQESVGANGHWSVYTHARVADILCERIREVLCLP